MLKDAAITNVPKSVADAVNAATTASDLREALIQSMARAGMPVPETFGPGFNYHSRSDVETGIQPMPVSPGPSGPDATHIRFVYPSGNDRYEITGASEEELDEKQRRIEALYGGHR
jgi:hypothetical protein